MITIKQFRYTASLAVTIGLSACAALNDEQAKTLAVTQVFSATNCNIAEQGITKIKDQADFYRTLEKVNSHRLSPPALDLSSVDFSASQVLLISLGNKPNSGHSLNIVNNWASLNSGVLNLPIEIKAPAKDKMYAQMITSPCLIITLPTEPYEAIHIEGM